jgi:hypothetical protein
MEDLGHLKGNIALKQKQTTKRFGGSRTCLTSLTQQSKKLHSCGQQKMRQIAMWFPRYPSLILSLWYVYAHMHLTRVPSLNSSCTPLLPDCIINLEVSINSCLQTSKPAPVSLKASTRQVKTCNENGLSQDDLAVAITPALKPTQLKSCHGCDQDALRRR